MKLKIDIVYCLLSFLERNGSTQQSVENPMCIERKRSYFEIGKNPMCIERRRSYLRFKKSHPPIFPKGEN